MQVAGLKMIEDSIDEDAFMAAMISSFADDEVPLVIAIAKMAD